MNLIAGGEVLSDIRYDERFASSPVGAGWIERTHFGDACASLWIDGELVHLEHMVLRRRRRHQFVLKSAGPDRARDGAAARLGRHSRRDAQGDAAGGAQDRRGAGLEGGGGFGHGRFFDRNGRAFVSAASSEALRGCVVQFPAGRKKWLLTVVKRTHC